MARDFNTEFLAILQKLREIKEPGNEGLQNEIAVLNTVGLSKDDIWLAFLNIYDYFHADVDLYKTLDEKIARANIIRDYYRRLTVKLLRGKPQEFKDIPLQILFLRKNEKVAAQKEAAKKAEEIAIHDLMTNALVSEVVKGGGRKKTKGKRKTQRRRRTSRKH